MFVKHFQYALLCLGKKQHTNPQVYIYLHWQTTVGVQLI